MTDLRCIFFDLGDVVCHFFPERRLTALASAARLGSEEIQYKLWDSGFSEACDAGRYAESEMYRQICQRLGVSLPCRELCRLWTLAFAVDAEVLAIATEVRCHLPTGLLTNNAPILRRALPEFLPDLERHFSPIIFSYQHGVLKPSFALYDAVARSLGVAAHEVLLIDDAQRNVRGAEAAGWKAIHFTTPGKLRETLHDLGIAGMSV